MTILKWVLCRLEYGIAGRLSRCIVGFTIRICMKKGWLLEQPWSAKNAQSSACFVLVYGHIRRGRSAMTSSRAGALRRRRRRPRRRHLYIISTTTLLPTDANNETPRSIIMRKYRRQSSMIKRLKANTRYARVGMVWIHIGSTNVFI